MKFKKIDVILVIAILIISAIFMFKLGYIGVEPGQEKRQDVFLSPEPEEPEPPESFVSSFPLIKRERAVIEPVDEGAHYSKLLVNREWWVFTGVFDGENSGLHNWSFTIGFAHMAYGDIFGRLKPDLFFISLHDNAGHSYGGFVNKRRNTLETEKSQLNIKFDESWAEGQLPHWHIHVEDDNLDGSHDIMMDLQYEAILPIRNRLVRDIEKSQIEQYLVLECSIHGTVKFDEGIYQVNGTGMQEHTWTPAYVRRGLIPPRLNGWNSFYIRLNNGWNMYIHKSFFAPQFLSSKRLGPEFGWIFITPDGEHFTEFRCFTMKPTQTEEKTFLIKEPTAFHITASRKWDTTLNTINLNLDITIKKTSVTEKIWRFPSCLGMWSGSYTVDGSLSWSEEEETHTVDLSGKVVSWITRATP